jgi:predicted ATPase/class 3 adenylate cyclase
MILTVMPRALPTGTVTFLFTDVEGSTRLLHELGSEGYAQALADHRRVIREACASEGGAEVDTQGDAFFFAFPTAPGALGAASAFTEALSSGPISVRVGLHTGTPLLTEEGYVGGDVHRAARIAAAGHGGQVLVSSSTAQLVGRELADLGEHRLKDLSAPERIFQLGDGDFPALKSLFRTNLPVPATPFLGRERELEEVVELLSTDDARLLTLTGPGGTGKTRLALQAAGMASDGYPDGVWWIPLASLRDPELVLETAGQTLGSKDGLAEHIQDKAMLCLFDNFEQVVEAASELAALVSACPNLDVLVTSREPLHLSGEQEYAVPPLAHEEGVGFFLARARAITPDFATDEAVSKICARLDDLPLALELAAARVKALTPLQILERLEQQLPLLTGGARDAPERQRTLKATIEWSYDLLARDEQELFARLSVFRGGCTLEAAEEVCDADVDTLQSLVDKSLLRFGDGRYWMLETIREYAVERLAESGESDRVGDRCVEHFLSVAQEAEPHLSRDEVDWVDRLNPERDNLRATFDALEASGDGQRTLRFAVAIARFWYLTTRWPEGRRLIEAALSADESPTAARAMALNEAAAMAVLNGDYAAAKLRAEESLGLGELHDERGLAYARFQLGFAAVEGGDYQAAVEPLEESLRLFEELGDEYYWGIVAFNLGWALDELGERDRSSALNEESLRRARAAGNTRHIVFSLDLLATIAMREGRTTEALPLVMESLPLSRELRDPGLTADHVRLFASVFAALGKAEVAVRLLAFAMKQYEELGLFLPDYVVKSKERTLDAVRTQLDDDEVERAWDEGRRLTVDEAVALALAEVPSA